jgi:hypothetical protein
MQEPPPVSFGYCFKVMGWWILASVCWAAILAVPFAILRMLFG